MKDPDALFYIAVNNVSMKSKSSEECWFKCNAVGTNKLEGLMKEMSKKAGLQNDKLRNHSARKTMIQILSENNVPPTQIAQLSGHKNLKSIEYHSHLSTKQQMYMSNVLANISSECSSITPFTPAVTPSTSAVFRPEGACGFSNPGPTVYGFILGCRHSWRTVFCDHQHCESIATASSSLGKATMEKKQSL